MWGLAKKQACPIAGACVVLAIDCPLFSLSGCDWYELAEASRGSFSLKRTREHRGNRN